MTVEELQEEIEQQKALMVAVATGGPRIQEVNTEYRHRRSTLRRELEQLGLTDPNPFADLWKWYGKWSTDLSSYASRREYVSDLYQPLLDQLSGVTASVAFKLRDDPTGVKGGLIVSIFDGLFLDTI
ncbi:MAG: hypothetical protein WD942_01505, partial [Dehalococcoidia bacterium]